MVALGRLCDAVLWWSYRRVEWWQRVVRRRVTFLGWLVIGMVFLSACFGTDVLNNALGFLFCFCAFMLLVEIISLVFRKSEVKVRSVPMGVVHSGSLPKARGRKVSAVL